MRQVARTRLEILQKIAATFPNFPTIYLYALHLICIYNCASWTGITAVRLKPGDTVNERLLVLKNVPNITIPVGNQSFEFEIVKKKKLPRKKHHRKSKLKTSGEDNGVFDLLLRPKTTDPYESLLSDLPEVDAAELEPFTPSTSTTTQKSTISTSLKTVKPSQGLSTTNGNEFPVSKFLQETAVTVRSTTTTSTPRLTPGSIPILPQNATKKCLDKFRIFGRRSKSACKREQVSVIQGRNENQPEVVTRRGRFRGKIIMVNKSEVRAFYGISYAAAPVKDLRFKIPFPPEPEQPDMVIDATQLKSPCFPAYHDSVVTNNWKDCLPNLTSEKMPEASENCLYLNIWAPKVSNLTKLMPVVVWINGEGFLSGRNGTDHDLVAGFVEMTKTVFVNIQYRQGAFGFLYFGSTDALGNMGLLDQIQALQWIDENIESFGGNPNAITLMGHGIGAAFVGFHLLSKISPSFFKRAILLGGAPTQSHVFKSKESLLNASLQFSTELGCNNHSSNQPVMDCLMSLDAHTIWKVQSLFHSNSLSFPFVPTNDGHVLEDTPKKLLEERRGKVGKVLVGVAANAGSTALLNSVEGVVKDKPSFFSYDKFLRVMTHIFRRFSRVKKDFILQQYTNWHNLEDGYANQLKISDAITDHYYICPLRQFSDLWSARGLSTNFFLFSQASHINRSEWMGAVHGDELNFIFGLPIRFPSNFTQAEVKLSGVLVKIMENFIKSGTIASGWERYGRETPSYVDFKGSKLPATNHYGPRARECSFWNELLPQI